MLLGTDVPNLVGLLQGTGLDKDNLGKAWYLITLDLTRGYWQVPVAADAHHKTAFATLFGLHQSIIS